MDPSDCKSFLLKRKLVIRETSLDATKMITRCSHCDHHVMTELGVARTDNWLRHFRGKHKNSNLPLSKAEAEEWVEKEMKR